MMLAQTNELRSAIFSLAASLIAAATVLFIDRYLRRRGKFSGQVHIKPLLPLKSLPKLKAGYATGDKCEPEDADSFLLRMRGGFVLHRESPAAIERITLKAAVSTNEDQSIADLYGQPSAASLVEIGHVLAPTNSHDGPLFVCPPYSVVIIRISQQVKPEIVRPLTKLGRRTSVRLVFHQTDRKPQEIIIGRVRDLVGPGWKVKSETK